MSFGGVVFVFCLFFCVIACIAAFNAANGGTVYEDDGYTTVTTTTYGGP